MDQKEMLKQMVAFNQTNFNNAYSALVLLQEQFEQVAKTVLDQANWLPAEGRNAIENYVESFKTGRDNFKKYVDESYQKVEKYFED